MEKRPPLDKEEYEIQFYGKAVREMSRELAEYYIDVSEDSIKSIMKKIADQIGRKQSLLDNQLKLAPSLLEGFRQRQAKSMKKVQFMLEEKICHIPNDVVLPRDRCQIKYGQEEAVMVQKDFDCVQSRFKAVRFLKELCKKEIEMFEVVYDGSKSLIDEAEMRIGDVENSRVQQPTISMMKQIKLI